MQGHEEPAQGHQGQQCAEEDFDAGWYTFLEDTLASAAEEAQGYRIMHEKSHKHYSKISSRLTIPAIILSTLTGVANFGQQSLETYVGKNAPLYIGAISIIAAIFATVAKYLRADEKSELHRSSMVQWDKLLRMLTTVLTQPRSRRIDAQEFLLQYREERNRLSEQVPVIPYKIRVWFLQHYGADYTNTNIRKPGILALSDVTVYRANEPMDPEAPPIPEPPDPPDPPARGPRRSISRYLPHMPHFPYANSPAQLHLPQATAGTSPSPGSFVPRSSSPGSLAARMSAGNSHFSTRLSPPRHGPQLASVARRVLQLQQLRPADRFAPQMAEGTERAELAGIAELAIAGPVHLTHGSTGMSPTQQPASIDDHVPEDSASASIPDFGESEMAEEGDGDGQEGEADAGDAEGGDFT